MTDLLSRRGFLKMAAAAGAGLCLPAPAFALDAEFGVRLAPYAEPSRLTVGLYLRHGERAGIVLPANAIRLDAKLRFGEDEHDLALASAPIRRIVSRAGPSRDEGRPVIVPPDHEVLYGSFLSNWPPSIPRGRDAVLSVRTVLLTRPFEHPREQQSAIRALGRVRSETQVTIPA